MRYGCPRWQHNVSRAPSSVNRRPGIARPGESGAREISSCGFPAAPPDSVNDVPRRDATFVHNCRGRMCEPDRPSDAPPPIAIQGTGAFTGIRERIIEVHARRRHIDDGFSPSLLTGFRQRHGVNAAAEPLERNAEVVPRARVVAVRRERARVRRDGVFDSSESLKQVRKVEVRVGWRDGMKGGWHLFGKGASHLF